MKEHVDNPTTSGYAWSSVIPHCERSDGNREGTHDVRTNQNYGAIHKSHRFRTWGLSSLPRPDLGILASLTGEETAPERRAPNKACSSSHTGYLKHFRQLFLTRDGYLKHDRGSRYMTHLATFMSRLSDIESSPPDASGNALCGSHKVAATPTSGTYEYCIKMCEVRSFSRRGNGYECQ